MSCKKTKEKQRSIFDVCFPCFSKTYQCDDLVCHAYGKDFCDYEYVLENLAIKRVPKSFLDERQVCQSSCNQRVKKKRSDCRVKMTPPEVSIGPVTMIPDATDEEMLRGNVCEPCLPTFPEDDPGPECPGKRGGGTRANYYVETHSGLEDNVIRQILNPHVAKYEKAKPCKVQVSADVHRADKEEDHGKAPCKICKPTKMMPTEIKETIEALKMAKPHACEYPPRNRRSLVRTVSTTSCDKETSCNFFDLKYMVDRSAYAGDLDPNSYKEEAAQQKKRPTSPMKFKSSSSNSEGPFPDIIECEEKESCDLNTTEKSGTCDKGQSLKWKIIINKHKKDKKI